MKKLRFRASDSSYYALAAVIGLGLLMSILSGMHVVHSKTDAWAIFILGFLTTALSGSIVYTLIEKNIAVLADADLKTKRLEEATKKANYANETKSRFLANVSHEIRTPLNLILGMADLLVETPLNDEQKNYVSTFRRSGNHLLDVINDILDVARIEAGEVVYEEKDVDLVNVIESVSDFVSSACRSKKLSYSYYISPKLPRFIKGDQKRIRQILINLINNAMKFTLKGGISLTVQSAGGADGKQLVTFEVRDTGIGIPAEELTKIFKEFYQVDAGTTRNQGGVGLGLAIVKTYVEYIGGTIDVKSTVGHGTVFTVQLPFQKIFEDTWLKEFTHDTESLKSKRVFLLTPNQTMSRFIRDSFELIGVSVHSLDHGLVAINFLKQNERPFDHYIIDMVGQDLGGLDVARKIADKPNEIEKVILLSPLVHRYKDKAIIEELGIKNICFAPLKLKLLVNCMLGKGDDNLMEFKKVGKPIDEIEKGLKLLVAEDDEDNRHLIKAYLSHYDVHHDFAENGQAALDRYKQVAPNLDLMITDLQMPVMDGFELIKNVRAHEKENGLDAIHIVMLTADAQPEQIENMKSVGGNDYITKPVSKNKLVELLSHIRKRQAA